MGRFQGGLDRRLIARTIRQACNKIARLGVSHMFFEIPLILLVHRSFVRRWPAHPDYALPTSFFPVKFDIIITKIIATAHPERSRRM